MISVEELISVTIGDNSLGEVTGFVVGLWMESAEISFRRGVEGKDIFTIRLRQNCPNAPYAGKS